MHYGIITSTGIHVLSIEKSLEDQVTPIAKLVFSVVLHPVIVWSRKLLEVNLLPNLLRRVMKRDFVSLRCLLEF